MKTKSNYPLSTFTINNTARCKDSYNSNVQVMTPEEKQSHLRRHRAIVLATIDYLNSLHTGSFVLDNEDHIARYYEQQKLETEKYFKQRRLDRLQQRLSSLTKSLQIGTELNYAAYVKENTGYEIDIFQDLQKRVDLILSQSEIRTKKEENDIATMLDYLLRTSSKQNTVDKLKSLLLNYAKETRSRKKEYSEIISRVENNGIEEITISCSTGPKPKHYKEQVILSPDKKRKIFLTEWSNGKQSSTTVAIQFNNGNSGAIYCVNGICPDVKASWKNNAAILIETKDDHEPISQHKEVRSFDDCITIEYVNTDEKG